MRIILGKRRIVRQNADGTKTVSLPKAWLDTVGLKEGDSLNLEMAEDGSLILRPVKDGGDDAKTIQ